MVIYMDDGGGVTEDSIAFYRHAQIGRIIRADVSRDPLKVVVKQSFDSYGLVRGWVHLEYTLILFDNKRNELWLSGCNCGYGGTGPHGTYTILQECGLLSKNTSFERSGISESSMIILTGGGRK